MSWIWMFLLSFIMIINFDFFMYFLLVHKLWLFHAFLLVHSQHNLENAMRKLYSPHLFEGPVFFRKQQAFISMVRNISRGIAPKKKQKLMLHVRNMFTYISSCSCGHFLGKSSIMVYIAQQHLLNIATYYENHSEKCFNPRSPANLCSCEGWDSLRIISQDIYAS